MGPGKEILLWYTKVGTTNAKRNGKTAIVKNYMQLVRRGNQTQVEQIIISGILPVMGSRRQGY